MRELRIEVLDEGSALRLVDAAGTPLGRRSLAPGEIDALVDEVATAYDTRAPDLARLGRRLFDWLDGSGQRWLSSQMAELRNEGLTLRLGVGHRLRHLPWELAAGADGLLAASVTRPFCPVREVVTAGGGWEAANRPLRALFMAASPENVSPLLDYEAEEVRILAAAGAGGVELVVEEQGSLAGLRQRLRDHEAGWCDVMHLTGHADVSASGVPHLLMETDTGRLDRVDADRLIEAVEGRWPRVTFVSGCRTGAAPDGGLLPSFAEQLVAAGAPCVIGWGHPVGDIAATTLAAALYEQLGVGERVDAAIARARLALLRSNSNDWHLLRAYADASSLGPLVSAPATVGRPRLRIRRADVEFLDANAQRPVCSHDRFVGRRRLLQRSLRTLTTTDQADSAYAEGVLLHGMGGLGKSSAAARLCERLGDYRRLVWVGELDDIELARVVGEQFGAAAGAILNQPGLDTRQRVRACWRASPSQSCSSSTTSSATSRAKPMASHASTPRAGPWSSPQP
ncbi:MAG: CHAT domain-containing protein [Acidimicrobiales bacterium]